MDILKDDGMDKQDIDWCSGWRLAGFGLGSWAKMQANF
jgi:hypothetical protein